MLSRVWLSCKQWTVAHQASLSMGFLKQEYWSVGCHFLLQGDLPDPGIKPMSPALAGGLFTTEPSKLYFLAYYVIAMHSEVSSVCVILQKLCSNGKHKNTVSHAKFTYCQRWRDNRGKIIADILEIIKKVRIKSADYTNSYFHPSANISSTNNCFVLVYKSKDKKETLVNNNQIKG